MLTDEFVNRHIGPRDTEISLMLDKIGVASLDQLIDETVPASIRLNKPLDIPGKISEYQLLQKIKKIASKNKVFKNYIGLGYYGTVIPAVIQRNILENPSWYTSYTPYQAEISQGRLEALLNYQTMIMELTGMELANASLLDEATAAAEAMIMMYNARSRSLVKNEADILYVDENIFPQTLDVIRTRALPLKIQVITGRFEEFTPDNRVFGAIVQYPGCDGEIKDYANFTTLLHHSEALITVAADILSLALLVPPGEWDADIVVGSTQRFGIPLGYGGPHAAYFATRDKFKRSIPGRIIGVSKDVHGNPALRMALQTREQHIKREKATSNICTAQALLASMASMYAVYHGAEGLKQIALRIHSITGLIAEKLKYLGYKVVNTNFFDTITIKLPHKLHTEKLRNLALANEINLCYLNDSAVAISFDETTSLKDINLLLKVFAPANDRSFRKVKSYPTAISFDPMFSRKSEFLTHDVFNLYRSETEIMRYIKKLERKDFSLTHSMISLGSCTMKLNAAVEMLPLSWNEFGELHPFVPVDQAKGYHKLLRQLEADLMEITGFSALAFQPNSGAQGEYAGLMVIREYLKRNNQDNRDIVLIPASAHGTNPASAVMAGLEVVIVDCDERGNINLNDLKNKAEQYKHRLAAFMVTYPSTHGVFESEIMEMCQIIHDNGGQVYMDGANMNAQVGLTNPAKIGADVCHLNLHKTFAIPHGGGGPGAGPIAVAEHLAKYLPSHPVVDTGRDEGIGAIAAAPYGSALITIISYIYIKLMGGDGLTYASKIAILNANYLAACLKDKYGIVYSGEKGRVAHEMILECRNFKSLANITESDIAKRLMDYGFHAPTLSFPVHGTLMIEPTESESLQELNRFVEAMLSIHNEIMEIKESNDTSNNNVLKNAPHTAEYLTNDTWNHPYSRHKAAYPLRWIAENKFWPSVGRIDDAFGDRNLHCSCTPLQDYRK